MLIPFTDVGAVTPPVPWLPEAPEPPRCVTVTRAPGVPAVRLGLTFTDVLAFPPDAFALGLRPELVPALGLVDAFVFDDAGAFFDDFVVTLTPEREPEPFALAFGDVVVEFDLALWLGRCRAAAAVAGIASAATRPKMITAFFMSDTSSHRGAPPVSTTSLGRTTRQCSEELVISLRDQGPDSLPSAGVRRWFWGLQDQ